MQPTRIERPRPTAEWRVEASTDTRVWTDDVTVRRYRDARYGETVRLNSGRGHGEVSIMMTPEVARRLADAVLSAADWVDPQYVTKQPIVEDNPRAEQDRS
jgi:hypothetical protein